MKTETTSYKKYAFETIDEDIKIIVLAENFSAAFDKIKEFGLQDKINNNFTIIY